MGSRVARIRRLAIAVMLSYQQDLSVMDQCLSNVVSSVIDTRSARASQSSDIARGELAQQFTVHLQFLQSDVLALGSAHITDRPFLVIIDAD